MFRIGVIGVGRITTETMIPTILKSECASLQVIGTSSPEKASALKKTYDGAACYPSYEQVVDHPDVEGIYIGLPNHLHKSWTLRALAAGKHVLCEKPLALDAVEAKEMVTAAKRAGRVLLEGFMYRFHPQHALVKELLAEGAIGRIQMFEAHVHTNVTDSNDIRLQVETGGGCLLDVGCYGIDSARYLMESEPCECVGTWRVGSQNGVDEFCHFTLRFPDNVPASITCGTQLPPGGARYTLFGDQGEISLGWPYVVGKSPHTKVVLRGPRGRRVKEVVNEDQFALQLAAFVSACRGDHDPRLTDGLQNMRGIDAVRRACETGKIEQIP